MMPLASLCSTGTRTLLQPHTHALKASHPHPTRPLIDLSLDQDARRTATRNVPEERARTDEYFARVCFGLHRTVFPNASLLERTLR